jgi:tRNA(Glu) U13 pseudouridine synthase TruD
VAKEGVEHQLLRVSSVAHGDLQSIDRRSKQQAKWYPGDKTQHLVVTMEKRNRDTSDALMTLSRLCGLSPRQIGIAGTKDKRAITTQNISFFRITATRIRDAMNAYYSRFAVNPRLPAAASTTPLTAAEHGPDIVLGNFRYAEEKRHLGMLSGNRFSVRLRNMDFKADADAADAAKTPAAPAPAAPAAAAPAEADEDEIPMEPADRMTSSRMRRETSRFSDRSLLPPARPVPIERAAALIKHVLRTMQVTSSTGFLNYFGIQRFGSSPISTHIVGLAVLHGNYKRALELVLLPRPNEAPPMRFAKSVLAGCVRRPVLYELEDPYVFPEATDHDLPAALHHLPNSAAIERSLLQGMMTSNPRDYKNLFGCILRTQRTLYVSAYQSYLFNAALSARFDLAVMAGHPDVTTEADLLKPLAGDIVLVNAHAAHNDAPAAPAAEEDEDAAADNEGDVSTESDMLSGDARVLTAAEAQSGAYSLSDVVFPLMAPGVLLPTNAAGDRVREMMSRDSLYLATPDAWGKQDSATYLSPGIREHVDSVVKTHKAAVAAANASDTEVPVWDPWVVLSAPGGVMAGQSKPFFRPMCRAPSQLTWAVTLRQVPAKGVAAQACVTSHTGMHPSRLAGLAAAAEADAMAEAGQGEEVCVVSGGSGETVELSRGGDSQVLGADAVVDAVCGLGQSLDEDAKARGVSVELHTQFSLSSSTYATTLLREILKAPASQSTRAQAYKLAKR